MLSLKQTLIVSITLLSGLSLTWIFGAPKTITNEKASLELIFNDAREPVPISKDAPQLPRHHTSMDLSQNTPIRSAIPKSADEANRLMALENTRERQIKMLAFLSDWAIREPYIAYQWVSDQPMNDETLHFHYVVLRSFLETEPEQAELLILDLPDSHVKMDLAMEYVQELAYENPGRALNLIESFSDNKQKHMLMQSVLDSWAYLDPHGALDYLSMNASADPELTATFADSLFNQIVFDDIPYWQSAIYQYPESIQIAIAQGIVAKWAQKDPNAALTWISGLPEGPLRERANQEYLDNTSGEKVTEVFEMAEILNNSYID